MVDWTHFDNTGKPVMVNVGGKEITLRRALAEGWVELPEIIYDAVKKNENLRKGNPIPIAEMGGIVGAKKTPELIPLCHFVKLNGVKVRCELCDETKSVHIKCEVEASDTTGVEMEALTGVSVAALVFYDMCKGLDKGMVIKNIRLLEKSGGRSGTWKA